MSEPTTVCWYAPTIPYKTISSVHKVETRSDPYNSVMKNRMVNQMNNIIQYKTSNI